MAAESRPTRAAESVLVRRLEAEWRILARSRWLRKRLEAWAADDPRLAFDDGDQLVASAQRRDAASWNERDQVLAALLELASDDRLARRVALQVVLPGMKNLIDTVRGWDVEERAGRVIANAIDVLAWCAAEPARTPPNFRIYANTRRRVLRAAIRDRTEPVTFLDDHNDLEPDNDPFAAREEPERFDELVEWVRHKGRVQEEAARLVVLTRAGGVSIDELAATRDVDAQTLRQRRLRTERRVRQGHSLGR